MGLTLIHLDVASVWSEAEEASPICTSVVLPELALSGLAPRHLPVLLDGASKLPWTPGETGTLLDPPARPSIFFSPSESSEDARKQGLCEHGLALLFKKSFSSHSLRTLLALKTLKSLFRVLRGLSGLLKKIEILSAGTLVLGMWSMGQGVLKTCQPMPA